MPKRVLHAVYKYLPSELADLVANKDSLDAQLVAANEEKRALLSTECESKMVSIMYFQ